MFEIYRKSIKFKNSIILKRPITGLVNNAGIRQRKEFNKISKNNLKEVFDINFFSIFEIMKIILIIVKI